MKIEPKTTTLAKLSFKLKSAGQSVAGNAGTSPAKTGESKSSWLTQGAGNIASEVANLKVQAQKKFAPEFYLRDGESKDVRLRTSEPLGLFKQYSVRINGNWNRITAPAAGERDLMREAGLKAATRVIYELIDIEGYTDKKGVAHRNVARFFVTNMRIHEQLELIRKKKGGLTAFNINISRTGKGQSTTYSLLPDEVSASPSGVLTIRADLDKYYAPPSLAEQQTFMAGFDPAEQGD